MERYARNQPALSAADCARLAASRVAVIGCGGLGGHIIDQLARLGLGQIVAVDGDVFEPSNLNRQLLSSPRVLGRSKAQVAREYVQSINPGVELIPVAEFLGPENADGLLAGCSLALDGLDNIPARRCLAAACDRAGIPLVFGAVSGWVAQAALLEPGSGALARLYPEGVELPEDKSVLAFAPALCAGLQVSLALRRLLGRPAEPQRLLWADLLHGDFETLPLD